MYYSFSNKPIMNFQEEFYRVMTRLRANSRAASSLPDARVWEMDSNGVIVSKPLKKVTVLSNQEKRESEPEVIDLQEYAKSGKAVSVSGLGINKVKAIHDFMFSNGRRF